MRFYVASKFENADAVKVVYDKLKKRGHTITHDWTAEDATNKTQGYKTKCAINDYIGVRSADAIIVLNHPKMFGGAAELGMAIAFGVPAYVVDMDVRENIFFHLPGGVYECSDSDNAIADAEDDHGRF